MSHKPLDWAEELALSDDLVLRPVCGVDEAGRGPLAGRVYAAAVILPYDKRNNETLLALDDSKKLSEKKREFLSEQIKDIALSWCVAYSEVEEIEEINILQASLLAMRRAIDGLQLVPYGALIDGNINRGFELLSKAVIDGDAISPSIAAASILAKVARDSYCRTVLDKDYPEYGFSKHKGYGTAAHYAAITQYGLCPFHRKSFFKKYKGGVLFDRKTENG
jgi:Ribonuclease HII